MEDIIFAGSVKRKALSLAEVTLVLDNSKGDVPLDFSEICVSRRVDRSGESQYLLNRVPCRLKDIQELFADTGLGKDAYSCVGQGRIDEILGARPEERRGLVEEAAGIVRYRNRKREALRKMEQTDRNLERVGDIIDELSSQVEPLCREAERAREYQGYEEEMRDLEIALAVGETLDATAKRDALEQTIRGLSDRREEARASHDDAEANLETLREEIERLGREEERVREDLRRAGLDVERLRVQVEALEERLQALAEEEDGLDKELRVLLEEARQASEMEEKDRYVVDEIRSLFREAERLVAIHQEEFSRLSGEVKALRASVERDKAEVIEVLNERSRAMNLREALRVREETARREAERLAQRRVEMEKALGETLKRERIANSRSRECRAASEEEARKLESLKEHQEETSRAREDAARGARLASERLSSVTSRLGALKEMESSFEGFAVGPRSLLAAASRDKALGQGILGPVARLLEVDPGREKALEAALGSRAQHIVVRAQTDATRAIDYLRKTGSGRATFLPLDLLAPSPINAVDLRKARGAGSLGTALDMVRTDPSLGKAVEFLLGRVLVASGMEAALSVAKATALRYKVVTLDGDVVWPGGSISGGAPGTMAKTGFLARADEIRRLETEAKQVDSSLKEAERVVDGMTREIKETAERIAQAEAVTRNSEAVLADAQNEVVAAERERERLENEIRNLEWEEAQTLEADSKESPDIDSSLESIAQREANLREGVFRAERDLTMKEENLARATAALSDARVEAARRTEALQAREEALTARVEARSRFERGIATKREALARVKERIDRTREDVGALRLDLEESEIRRQQSEASLQLLVGAFEEKTEASSAMDRRLKRLRKTLGQMDAEIHSFDLDKTRLDAEISASLRRIQGDYGLSLEVAVSRVDSLHSRGALPDAAAIPKRLGSLKEALVAMGDVNLGAIREYQRVKERHDFLDGQRRDLWDSRESLERLIKEIDRNIKDLFMDTFGRVREAFRRVFQELFNGGSADLVLTDENNPLETGVDIVARPPGRKTQSLSLLSGGERSLTAIALLFALLTVKPSPFVVLDEIEAALDEANVQRFTKMLRTFSENTQFIVVSHQRGTMQCAQALYGVTMEDTGVSKLVSVRFGEDEEAI